MEAEVSTQVLKYLVKGWTWCWHEFLKWEAVVSIPTSIMIILIWDTAETFPLKFAANSKGSSNGKSWKSDKLLSVFATIIKVEILLYSILKTDLWPKNLQHFEAFIIVIHIIETITYQRNQQTQEIKLSTKLIIFSNPDKTGRICLN